MKLSDITIIQQSRYCIVSNKQPLEPNWQKGNSLVYCKKQHGKVIKGKPVNGIGLITGEFDGVGILAIDFDGLSSYPIAEAIAHFLVEDNTLSWSSGKEGRLQRLYQIPHEHLSLWRGITVKRINKFSNITCNKGEQLELRYGNCQSVMPPSVHPETGKYEWVNETLPQTLTLYQSNLLLSLFREQNIIPIGISDHDLYREVKEALNYIDSDDYQIWLIVGMALKEGGYDVSLWDTWSSSSSSYKSGECEKKWVSFKKNGTTLGTLFKLAKDGGFDQKQWRRDNLPKQLERTLKSTEPTVSNELPRLIEELVSRASDPSLTDDQRQSLVLPFSVAHRIPSNSLLKAIRERLEQSYRDEALEQVELDHLLNLSQQNLDLDYIFGADLAKAIRDLATGIPTAPEVIVTTLLPAMASIIGTQARIHVKAGYSQPFIFRTMIVGNSGEKKTPSMNEAIRPLIDLNNHNAKRQKRAMAEWEMIKDNSDPQPYHRLFIVQDTTIDGLISQHQEHPKGLLCFVDELAGYFKRMNKFTKGDDIQRDLELYNGNTLIKTRANKDSNVYLERTGISSTGSIQWHTLENLGIDDDDSAGVLARWLICGIDLPRGYFNPNELSTEYQQLIHYLFEVLVGYDHQDLKFDPEAIQIFTKWQHKIINLSYEQKLNRIALKYAKIEGEGLRLCGIVHYLDMILNCGGIKVHPTLINAHTTKRALSWANWFLGQYAYVCTRCDGELIDGKLTKLLQIINRKPDGITASVAYNSNRSAFSGLTVNDVGELMQQLVKLQKVKLVPTKKGVKVKPL